MPDKKEIVNSIAAIGKRLGRAPSQAEFISLSGISAYYVLQYFRSWNDAVRTARLRPYTLNIRPEDRALLEDWENTIPAPLKSDSVPGQDCPRPFAILPKASVSGRMS